MEDKRRSRAIHLFVDATNERRKVTLPSGCVQISEPHHDILCGTSNLPTATEHRRIERSYEEYSDTDRQDVLSGAKRFLRKSLKGPLWHIRDELGFTWPTAFDDRKSGSLTKGFESDFSDVSRYVRNLMLRALRSVF